MFQAVGALVLVVGAVGGIYLGFGRAEPSTQADTRPVAVLDASVTTTPSVASLSSASAAASVSADALAQAKAAQAAADAAARAKKANETASRQQQPASRSQTRAPAPYPVPTSCKAYTGNQATGCALLLAAGFGLDQMPCLQKLWTKESHWNPLAENKSSGAYGIAQALPGNRMASYGADWRTNPVTQIKWGLDYITNRYKTPCNAWAHSQATGWY